MDGGLLSLKWNNHRSTFFYVLSNVRKKECYTDVTLACDGKFYPVHKLVLSTCSEYFEQMFEQTQCKHPVIVLKDIRSEELESLLSYMYVGEVNVVQEKLSGLIKAAECLRIKGLAVPDEEPATTKSSGGSREKRTSDNSLSSEAKRRRQDDGSSSQRQTSSREETSRRRADQSSSNKFNRNNASSSSSSVNSSRENRDSVSDHRTTSRDASEPNELHHAQQDNDIELKAEELPDAHEDLPSEVPPEDPGDAVKQEPLDLDAVYLSDSNSASDTKDMLVEDSFGEADGQQHFMDELLGQNSASDQHGMGDYGEGGEGSSSSSAATNQQQQHMVDGVVRSLSQSLASSTYTKIPQKFTGTRTPASRHSSSIEKKSMLTTSSGIQHSLSFSMFDGHLSGLVPQENMNITPFEELRMEDVHTPGRLFKCPVCEKILADKYMFRRHYMIHTGEKPYACPVCSYRTIQKGDLKFHILRRHHNIPA
ncbi:protein tramtrack, beta isoform isoform X15 [Hyalella azteca]|uniref:Protein tramtrack, beta isoform isoform X15 n=1 Tax=Hyalella azteca TaxID=294128 RepID=A0A8B7PAP0_HYAAZ|nr:protein tramtrack, beta isoform isoform X15 [Hyalella azteca]